jgi:1,4-dihydroxy-2-naphthoate octaprenyltransferase
MTDTTRNQLKNILLLAGGLLVLFQSAIPTPWEFIALGLVGAGAVLLYTPATWWERLATKNWFKTR